MKIFFSIYIVFVHFLLFLESFLIELPKFLDGRLFLILMCLLSIFFRYKKIKLADKKNSDIIFVNSLLIMLLALALMLTEKFYGFQFVEISLKLSYSRALYLSLALAITAAYTQSFYLSKKRLKISIFILPLLLTLVAFFIYLRTNHIFRNLVEDDHFIEYSQFFLLLFCSFISFFLKKYWWSKERFLGVLFILLTIACFFVAGEEISWGQRIFNLQTPDKLAERNLQGELTIHNIDVLFGMVYRVYMIIGLIGSTAWIFLKLVKKHLSLKMKKILSNLIPDWYLSPYFAVAFFYNYERFYLNPRVGEALWEEPMELLLIVGITLFLFIKLLRVYPKKFKLLKKIS